MFKISCLILGILPYYIDTSATSTRKLPSFLKICHQSDPKLNDCIKESVEQLKPYLVDGIPELSIPPCEPLTIREVIMNQGKGSVNVQSTYRNIKIYGPSQFVLKAVKVDLDKDKIRIKLRIPHLRMLSNYTIEGKILMLPISGSGLSQGNYTDIDVTCTIQGERVIRDSKTYFNVINVSVNFEIGHASVHFNNLFNGNKELGDAMNLFLNDNWKNVAQDMKPILEETISELIKKFSNKIHQKYSLEELLPM